MEKLEKGIRLDRMYLDEGFTQIRDALSYSPQSAYLTAYESMAMAKALWEKNRKIEALEHQLAETQEQLRFQRDKKYSWGKHPLDELSRLVVDFANEFETAPFGHDDRVDARQQPFLVALQEHVTLKTGTALDNLGNDVHKDGYDWRCWQCRFLERTRRAKEKGSPRFSEPEEILNLSAHIRAYADVQLTIYTGINLPRQHARGVDENCNICREFGKLAIEMRRIPPQPPIE